MGVYKNTRFGSHIIDVYSLKHQTIKSNFETIIYVYCTNIKVYTILTLISYLFYQAKQVIVYSSITAISNLTCYAGVTFYRKTL